VNGVDGVDGVDGWNWPEDDGGLDGNDLDGNDPGGSLGDDSLGGGLGDPFGDPGLGGFGLGGLGDADTADLGGPRWHLDPGADKPDPTGAGDGDHLDDAFHEPGHADAYVDEPLGLDPTDADHGAGEGPGDGVTNHPDAANHPDGTADPDAGADAPADAGAEVDSGFGPAEPVFGADPDAVDPQGWDQPEFPPSLDLPGLPDPVDGPPWSDPGLLGSDPLPEQAWQADPAWQPGYGGTADPAGLLEYAALDPDGAGTNPWSALLAADDPATAALARWWGPGG
jgi:hypothetical protein